MSELGILVFASALATYAWRALGVLLSGRIAVESELFKWVACVAYAMVAGLVSRIVFMPTGVLVETALVDRLGGCLVALLAYYASRRNLLVGVTVGVAAILLLTWVRG